MINKMSGPFIILGRTMIFCLLLIPGASALITTAEAASYPVQISVNTEPASDGYGWVTVKGVSSRTLTQLRKNNPDFHTWQRMFSVQLKPQSAPQSNNNEWHNVAGQYDVLDTTLRFVPSFPPLQGLAYRVSVQVHDHEPTKGVFVFNEAASPVHATTEVSAIYPSASRIPENTLRLYLHFSSSMRRGQAEEKIRLLDENGNVIQNAFVTGPLGELWDHDQRRLTLLLDPSRIKRGVASNLKLGPALKLGSQRTLCVDGKFIDAKGQAIKSEFCKTYEISEAIRNAISPNHWVIKAPALDTNDPLRIRFTRALDSGMLSHAIRVNDINGTKVAGRIYLMPDETEWHFIPDLPWSNNIHVINIATNLEDVSGNNLLAPLDDTISSSPPAPSRKKIRKHEGIRFIPVNQNN